jgi:hypothetical protein
VEYLVQFNKGIFLNTGHAHQATSSTFLAPSVAELQLKRLLWGSYPGNQARLVTYLQIQVVYLDKLAGWFSYLGNQA